MSLEFWVMKIKIQIYISSKELIHSGYMIWVNVTSGNGLLACCLHQSITWTKCDLSSKVLCGVEVVYESARAHQLYS